MRFEVPSDPLIPVPAIVVTVVMSGGQAVAHASHLISLERATGLTAKERGKRAQAAAKKGAA